MAILSEEIAKLKTMTAPQMREELEKWYRASVKMQKICNELAAFQTFASNAEVLQNRINQLKMTYDATIELKDNQIKQLMDLIMAYRDDPIGVGFRLDEMAKATTKLN